MNVFKFDQCEPDKYSKKLKPTNQTEWMLKPQLAGVVKNNRRNRR